MDLRSPCERRDAESRRRLAVRAFVPAVAVTACDATPLSSCFGRSPFVFGPLAIPG